MNDKGQIKEEFFRDLTWFYEELSQCGKKILILILPNFFKSNFKLINNFHRFLCIKFGFNLIDRTRYYKENHCYYFANMVDPAHQHITIMQELGENIANHTDDFLSPKKMDLKNKINFTILTPQDMIVDRGGGFKEF